MKRIDRLGQKFGRLLILGQWMKKGKSRVLALCDCGSLKEFSLCHLSGGRTVSCGCISKEISRLSAWKHKKHGMNKTPVHHVWSSMLQRCKNSKSKVFKNYGGRGITVCERWLKFENFYEDMGNKPKGLEIDRIDNNKGYYKENCRWVTAEYNLRNKRNSKWWFVNGIKYESAQDAGTALNLDPSTILHWCKGYKKALVSGIKIYPPKQGCYSELKYPV